MWPVMLFRSHNNESGSFSAHSASNSRGRWNTLGSWGLANMRPWHLKTAGQDWEKCSGYTAGALAVWAWTLRLQGCWGIRWFHTTEHPGSLCESQKYHLCLWEQKLTGDFLCLKRKTSLMLGKAAGLSEEGGNFASFKLLDNRQRLLSSVYGMLGSSACLGRLHTYLFKFNTQL